ncbi:DNA polymerase I [Candidatus Babeliales bacterium]|nr:DNA polymerase I [Candidatus Babeliales bacterium]
MKIDSEKTLFLIDGSSFLYRAYYGLRPLHTSKGEPVQAVYGFCKMIRKLIDTFKPKHLAIVWDSKGKTTRHEMFEAYKATRQAPPSDLFEQKEWILKIADAIQLHQLAEPGIEADDLMYSLAKEWEQTGGNSVIVTSDKDMGQMLNAHNMIFDSFKDVLIDEAAFEVKMGFPVKKAPFYFSLLGDASDNIPGVKGVGKKGALELVQQFEDLEDVYNNLDKIEKKRTRSALEANKDNAFLSLKLFLLQYHKTNVQAENLKFNFYEWANARALFEELDFKSLLKELGESSQKNIETSGVKGYSYFCISTEVQLDDLIKKIQEKKLCAYDTETDSVNVFAANMVGLSFCIEENTAYYIPCAHETGEVQLSREHVLQKLKIIFEDSTISKIAHHAKFDESVLFNYGIKVAGQTFDTLIAANLIKEEWHKNSLKFLSEHYLQEPMLTFAHMVTDKKLQHFGQVPLKEATEYAAGDAHQTFRLWPILKELLKKNESEDLYFNVELPTMQILFEMETRGIYCDLGVLGKLDIVVMKKLKEIKEIIFGLIGPDFSDINLNSPKQVEHLLFEYLQLPTQKKSAKRTGYSTDNEVLVELAKIHPVPGYIAQYRELYKLKSTYIDSLPEYINNRTGRIHTNYSQTRVATGRLSSSEPNLQNIPVEGLGSTVRMAFKPIPGNLFISADYSQIELRVLAHLSQDENLKQAFLAGRDIHTETAAGLFEIDPKNVTKEQRTVGKRINFSILYGLTPFGLSKDLDISLKDAKQYIDAYFAHYPKVRVWMDSVIEQTKKDGFVKTVYGRKRLVPGIYEHNKNMFELAKRIAINTVAQGTAAEIMKMGMIAVDKVLKEKGFDAHMLLQIHDEILVTVAKGQVDSVKISIKSALESVVDWEIPLIVDVNEGNNWREVK